MSGVTTGERQVATNRKARHEYHIEETHEAGIVLTGTEVKALRAGRASIQEAFARIEDGQVWLHHMHIPPYEAGNIFNHEPLRPRKLLLHRREIDNLIGRVQRDGYTVVPTALYWKGNKVKAEVALAKGKQA
ncbi:MAG TPA: SsrA-binding protein SmpB, partial [bacterium]|nr:SsrA-binding protein SmpB [bacterium]